MEPEVLGEGRPVAMAVPTEDVGMCLSADSEREGEGTYPGERDISGRRGHRRERTGSCHERT